MNEDYESQDQELANNRARRQARKRPPSAGMRPSRFKKEQPSKEAFNEFDDRFDDEEVKR